MVFARVASFFTTETATPESPRLANNGTGDKLGAMDGIPARVGEALAGEVEIDEDARRPPYIHVGALFWRTCT